MERASRTRRATPLLLRPSQGSLHGTTRVVRERWERWFRNSVRFRHCFFGWCCASAISSSLVVQLLAFAVPVTDPHWPFYRLCSPAFCLLESPSSGLPPRLVLGALAMVAACSCFMCETSDLAAPFGRFAGPLSLNPTLQHLEAVHCHASRPGGTWGAR